MARQTGPRPPAAEAAPPARTPVAVAVQPLHEPLWLVRIVLVLVLVGFAAYVALEADRFVDLLRGP